jgi:serine/threonine protein phosphatase PrpC
MIFDEYSYTNQGGRSYNEDAVGSKQVSGSGLFVVADGLGGHEHGELASACVRDTLLEDFSPMEEKRREWLVSKIAEANRRVLERQKELNSVLKSTVVALAIDGNRAVWANVGDSRLYYLHESAIYAYTEDHSVSYKKFKAGEITREQICTDEDQSRLLRSIGSEDRNEPDVRNCDVPLVPGDAFLLCSDGVWEYLRDEEILIDLLKAGNAKEWSELLLLRLMNRISGENDNLTLLTLMLK